MSKFRKPKDIASVEKEEAPVEAGSESPEQLWKVHQLMLDWIGRFDTKAAYVITIDSAALAAIWTLSAPTRYLADIQDPLTAAGFWAAVGLLFLSVLVAGFSVIPKHALTAEHSAESVTYFGHIRNMNATDFDLRVSQELNAHLSQAVIALAKVAWQKQRCVAVAMWMSLVAVVLLCAAGYRHSL